MTSFFLSTVVVVASVLNNQSRKILNPFFRLKWISRTVKLSFTSRTKTKESPSYTPENTRIWSYASEFYPIKYLNICSKKPRRNTVIIMPSHIYYSSYAHCHPFTPMFFLYTVILLPIYLLFLIDGVHLLGENINLSDKNRVHLWLSEVSFLLYFDHKESIHPLLKYWFRVYF